MSPKYPRQKLRSVSAEIYFPGSFAFTQCFAELQEEFSDRFTKLYVPNVSEGEPVALRAFQLHNDDDTRAIAFAINQCSYIAFGELYPGFEVFGPEASSVFQKAFSRCGIETYSKVTFRYKNVLRFHRGKLADPLPLDQVIAFGGASWFYGGGLLNLDLRWSQVWDDIGSMNFEISESDGKLSFEIAASVQDVPASQRDSAVTQAHDKAFETFEEMITPQYRALISEEEEA